MEQNFGFSLRFTKHDELYVYDRQIRKDANFFDEVVSSSAPEFDDSVFPEVDGLVSALSIRSENFSLADMQPSTPITPNTPNPNQASSSYHHYSQTSTNIGENFPFQTNSATTNNNRNMATNATRLMYETSAYDETGEPEMDDTPNNNNNNNDNENEDSTVDNNDESVVGETYPYNKPALVNNSSLENNKLRNNNNYNNNNNNNNNKDDNKWEPQTRENRLLSPTTTNKSSVKQAKSSFVGFFCFFFLLFAV